jgi:hypothetical protein
MLITRQDTRCPLVYNILRTETKYKTSMKGFYLMLKKIIALFSRPVPKKPYTPPIQKRCYQPELPFE